MQISLRDGFKSTQKAAMARVEKKPVLLKQTPKAEPAARSAADTSSRAAADVAPSHHTSAAATSGAHVSLIINVVCTRSLLFKHVPRQVSCV